LGGVIAASQDVDNFMQGAAKKISAEVTTAKTGGSPQAKEL
jgi:hypothetical protein